MRLVRDDFETIVRRLVAIGEQPIGDCTVRELGGKSLGLLGDFINLIEDATEVLEAIDSGSADEGPELNSGERGGR